MASKSSKAEIERLIRLSEASRSLLTVEYTALRHRLDVPARVRGSLRTHPTGWIMGSAFSGFVASRLLRRRKPAKKTVPTKSLLITLLGLVFAAAKPLLKIWLTGEFKRRLASSLFRQ